MIIINQDKTVMLNYENIEAIGVAQKTKDKFKIIAATVTNNEIEIAEYKTEERAKEVLITIMEWYNKLRTDIVNLIAHSYGIPECYYFKMPKE